MFFDLSKFAYDSRLIAYSAWMSKTDFRHFSQGRLRHQGKRSYFQAIEMAKPMLIVDFSKTPSFPM